MWTFSTLSELSNAPEDITIALQTGTTGGLWTKEAGPAVSNGGTLVAVNDASHWARQCDPGRLDARWFGVQANGTTDDAPALQAALDALPESGGQVLLPSGRMLCHNSILIKRSYISILGSNCGLLSKYFEPGHNIGQGSLLYFSGCDGIIIQPPAQTAEKRPPRLGGITMRDLGIAGTGRQDGQRGVVCLMGEGWRWGSTDGLMLERVYCIDLTWSAFLKTCDMTVLTGCWFSECGNGIHLEGCVYNCITNCCFADNDGIGLKINGGKGCEITSNIFVRNEHGILADTSERLRILGGTFETDAAGGARNDQSLITLCNCPEATITGATFSTKKSTIQHAIITTGTTASTAACTLSHDLNNLIKTND